MIRRLDRLGCAFFVCIAACQGDDAPPAAGSTRGSAEPATMLSPEPNAAGAPAAAGSGGATSPPDLAGAPAAATGGRESSPRAGSSAAPMPSAPPAAKPPAAACELPSSYTRAARFTLELTWPETLGFVAGTGTLVMWVKATYTRSSDGSLELELRPCAALTPAPTTTALAGGLKSSIQIPVTAFDSPNMPSNRVLVTSGDDRSLTFAVSSVLGAMLSDPDGEWPSSTNLVPFDHDGDGSPGLTALPVEGPEYAAPPSSIAQLEFLDRVYLATRARLRVSITPMCSGTADGTVEPLGFNSSIVGCHVKDRDECDAAETRFIATQSPRFMAGGSGTWTEVEVPLDASCADVRAALPPP